MIFTQGAHITKGVIQWGPALSKNIYLSYDFLPFLEVRTSGEVLM